MTQYQDPALSSKTQTGLQIQTITLKVGRLYIAIVMGLFILRGYRHENKIDYTAYVIGFSIKIDYFGQ